MMKMGSLFDGIGGFPLAGKMAGMTPVWASEIEPFPIRVTEKRLPEMKHYGDIHALNGAELEPVDVVTFGSPCQDLSVAGRREGLSGSRSGLFYEAIRIIREMRCATNGKYPRWAVWENVPGALSSHDGEDFRQVLQSLVGIKEPTADVPLPAKGKWLGAGEIMEDHCSLAWRILDASKGWGVAQRRRRVFVVLDLDGPSAGTVLFESEGLSRFTPPGSETRESSARSVEKRVGETGFRTEQRIECEQEKHQNAGAIPSHVPLTLKIRSGKEGGGKGPLLQEDRSATLGCNNDQTLFVPKVYGVSSDQSYAMLSNNPHSGFYEATTSRTIDTSGASPSCHQGGMAVVMNVGFFACETEASPALLARDWKDPPVVQPKPEYVARRLTPLECCRLQGFPDGWCDNLASENPSEEEIGRWLRIFAEWDAVQGKPRRRTRRQIEKWLKQPNTDSAEYKAYGNSVAVPCVFFVLAGIAYIEKECDDSDD